jgi:hypothetical protein
LKEDCIMAVRRSIWLWLALALALVIVGSLIFGDPRPTGEAARDAASRVAARDRAAGF